MINVTVSLFYFLVYIEISSFCFRIFFNFSVGAFQSLIKIIEDLLVIPGNMNFLHFRLYAGAVVVFCNICFFFY